MNIEDMLKKIEVPNSKFVSKSFTYLHAILA